MYGSENFKPIGSDANEVTSECCSKSSDENRDVGNKMDEGNHEVSDDKDDYNNRKTDEDIDVNIANYLKPEKVLLFEVEIEGKNIKSLIDTGATISLIKNLTYQKLTDKFLNNESVDIYGLENKSIATKGTIHLTVNWFGVGVNTKFGVTDDEDINHPVILGMDFLQNNDIFINLFHRRISKANADNSTTSIYVTTDGKVQNIIHENIPIYAKSNTTLMPESIVQAEVTTKAACRDPELNLLYVEGENSFCELLNGVVQHDEESKHVYISASNGMKTKKIIKEGDIVGRASTLLTIDVDEEENREEKWTLDRLKTDVALGTELNEEEKNKVYAALLNSQGALSINNSDIGKAELHPHHIELLDNTPIWQKYRHFSRPINQEIEQQCQELLSNDIIEHSDSHWSSPIVPVRKRDGTLRLCIDYRKVNKITKTENFPMPNLMHDIYKAHNVKFFTKLDLVRGFYQVPLDDDSKPITAFSTACNHFQFKRLSFGLKNSGIAFQKTMQQILSPLMQENIVIYIDDILIMSDTFEKHLALVSKVLNTLYSNNMKIKVSKCEFFQSKVKFLGHVISREGICKSPDFINKVREFPKPMTVSQLCQFLGLVNFQQKCIPNCSTIAKPLSEITGRSKRHVIKWTDEQSMAFERLKEEVAREITLSCPDYGPTASKMELFVDASGTGAGACLMQFQNGVYRIIGHASMSFSVTQCKYSTIERELTAIRFGLIAFRSFIYGVHFILYTDHRPLIYLHNMTVYSSRLQRMLDDIFEYNFIIKYRPGSGNQAADALSRLTLPTETDIQTDHDY